MISATRSDLGSALKDKLRFFFKSIAFKVKLNPLDFGQVTLHDFNSWFEMPTAPKAPVNLEKIELQNSDILVYFDNLNIKGCGRILQNV